MQAVLERAIALYQQDPIYWAGVLLWLFGFVAYVPSACGRGRLVFSNMGIALCWLGFALTIIAHFVLDGRYRVPPLERPTLDASYWRSSSTQIWLLWIVGSALIVASWPRLVNARVGWLGLATAMLGVVASWPQDDATRHPVIAVGAAILVTLLLVIAWREGVVRRRIAPGDYEAELIALCGNAWRARRLIRDEMKRHPGLSRAGAALAVVTRLRHERDPYPRPL
jgi:hypothetical protein